MNQPTHGPKIVVIGGGTGTFTILSALKNYARDITAVVNMSDDGGSTGILRDELGVLPPGDIRQCLVALSEAPQTMRDLFNYRFDEGTFSGHSFGNLFLTALEKTTGSFAEAVATASRVLNITGRVVPVTLDSVKLVLTEANGEVISGEYKVGHQRFEVLRPELRLERVAAGDADAVTKNTTSKNTAADKGANKPITLNEDAMHAIYTADLVVIAPGNLYGSLAPALIVPEMAEALQKTSAELIYISNLVTKPGQTDGFKVHDYAAEIERFIGADQLDCVIYNTHRPSKELLDKYAAAGEFAVDFDEAELAKHRYKAIGADIISDTIAKLAPADQQLIPRTLIRHDSDKLARLIMRLYFT